jgi:hypothetical protein
LMNFFHDRVVFHTSSSLRDSKSSSAVAIMGVARCNPTLTSLSRRITSPWPSGHNARHQIIYGIGYREGQVRQICPCMFPQFEALVIRMDESPHVLVEREDW